MLTFLALAGRLASPLLAFVPGFNPKVMMWFAGFFLVSVVIGGPAGAVWLHMRGEIRKAEVSRDLHWTIELQREKEAHDAKIQAAIEAAEHEPDLPADRALRLRECAKSPTCRDRRK